MKLPITNCIAFRIKCFRSNKHINNLPVTLVKIECFDYFGNCFLNRSTLMKIVKIIGFTLLFLIGIAFAAPYLFKGKLLELAKKQINKNSTAKTDFTDLDISFFRSFPKVSVALDESSSCRHR